MINKKLEEIEDIDIQHLIDEHNEAFAYLSVTKRVPVEYPIFALKIPTEETKGINQNEGNNLSCW